MAEAAIITAVQTLGVLLIERIGFPVGVEEEIRLLKGELERMKCFLRDAGEKQAANESVRRWISDIRDLAHDAEDVVEMFSLKVKAPQRRRRPLGRLACFPAHLCRVNKIAGEISRIKNRLRAIKESRETYRIQPAPVENALEFGRDWQRRVAPWKKDEYEVGLKKDEELLSEAVLAGRKGRSVASIVGMGGAGKSTLARLVYNNRKVVRGFDCRAWVVVSAEFRPEDLIKEVVGQVLRWSDSKKRVSEEMEVMQRQALLEKLHKKLKGRRYFIVLDDVWVKDHWESLQEIFPQDDKASVLLLTSRNQNILSSGSYVHKMKPLDSKDGWELFLNKAFVNDNPKGKCPSDLEETAKQIVEKCEGLPLAITATGGLLANLRRSKPEWEEFLRKTNTHLIEDADAAMAVLELSYHNLPPELKACFLCLGFFKEDAVIRAERLMHIWISLGLIPDATEDKARGFLNELIARNMVQVKDMREGERVKRLHVQDLLREISIKKAKEEIRFEILREKPGTSQNLDKPRHRAINCSEDGLGLPLKRNKRVRSLFYNGRGNVDSSSTYWRSFKLLRVLDFEGFGLRVLPEAVCEVSCLRYLGLRNNSLETLPTSLGRLKSLEVLDISKNLFRFVPDILWKMQSLRHLYLFSRAKCSVPLRIHTLKNIHTLGYIQLDAQLLDQLKHLTGLRKLGIELDTQTDVTNLGLSLALLENLVCLSIRRENGFKPIPLPDGLSGLFRITRLKLSGPFVLPPAGSFPMYVSSLSLVGTRFGKDPMVELGKLPMLLHLRLDCAYNGKKMAISRNGFSKLEVLELNGLCELTEIKAVKGAMPGLRRLEIDECPKLEILPKKLRSISNLKDY